MAIFGQARLTTEYTGSTEKSHNFNVCASGSSVTSAVKEGLSSAASEPRTVATRKLLL